MTSQTIDVQQFDFATLPSTGFYEVLGKRGTGKTTWTKFILQSSQYAREGLFIVMGGSETVRDSWSDVIHPLYVIDASVEYLEKLTDQRNHLIRQCKQQDREPTRREHVTLILDDVASIKTVMKSQPLSYLASNSRHLHMAIFILAQAHTQVPTEVRSQNDFLFVLATADSKNISRMREEYASSVDKRVFRTLLSFCTNDRGLLVVDNRTSSDQVSDICYMVRNPGLHAHDHRRLGPDQLWAFADSRYINTAVPTAEEAHEWNIQNDEDTTELTKKIQDSRKIYQDKQGQLVIRAM
jgi:hypothetical protein